MDYFRSMVAGSNEPGGKKNNVNKNEGAETVERLVERLHSATLYEDRRDAYKALRSLAKRYRLEVGSFAMPVLTSALKEKNSPEIISLALDALCCVIGESEDTQNNDDDADELGERFAEMLIKNVAHVSMVLALLEEYEFGLRRPAMHLVTGLLRHCPREMQDILLADPNAVPRMIDMLSETREVLRNDAILMLGELTRGNASIQKLVAYQNAFQMLLDIVTVEGESSIVIEDCMFVVLNLLKNNTSNQELFRENSLIQQLALIVRNLLWPQDEVDENGAAEVRDTKNGDDMGQWTTQRVNNVIFVFQAIRCLVSPSNPPATTASSQKIMHDCGLLQSLCRVLLAAGVTVEVLSEGIVTVAEMIRGSRTNQTYFQGLHAADAPDKTAVLVLLMSMANEKQPADLRCAVLYCFQAYLYNNEVAKNKIINTLLPSSADPNQSTTPGHYLCTMLVSSEPLQVWLGSVCLMHAILGSPSMKEQLLRVQVATSLGVAGTAPVSLLQQVVSILTHTAQRRALVRSGLLMLLCVWLRECPVAVAHLLHRDDNMTYLTTQVAGVGGGAECDDSDERVLRGLCALLLAFCVAHNDDAAKSRQSVLAIIERRIGVDAFVDCIESISRSESYVRAVQRTQPQSPPSNNASCVLLDFEFARMLRKHEPELLKPFRNQLNKSGDTIDTHSNSTTAELKHNNIVMNGGQSAASSITGRTNSPPVHSDSTLIVQSYKELIKRQDTQMADLSQQLKKLQQQLNDETKKSQNLKLKQEQAEKELKSVHEQLATKKQELEDATARADTAHKQLAETAAATSNAHAASTALAEAAKQKATDLAAEVAQLKTQVEHEQAMTRTWQGEVTRHQQFSQQWQQYTVAQFADPTAEVVLTLQQQLADMEQQLNYGYQMFEQQSAQVSQANQQIAKLSAECELVRHQCDSLSTRVDMLEGELKCERAARAEAEAKIKDKSVGLDFVDVAFHYIFNAPPPPAASSEKEEELASLRREQEDLLVLLADQDTKLREYRRRMRDVGAQVSDDGDDSEPEVPHSQHNNVPSNSSLQMPPDDVYTPSTQYPGTQHYHHQHPHAQYQLDADGEQHKPISVSSTGDIVQTPQAYRNDGYA